MSRSGSGALHPCRHRVRRVPRSCYGDDVAAQRHFDLLVHQQADIALPLPAGTSSRVMRRACMRVSAHAGSAAQSSTRSAAPQQGAVGFIRSRIPLEYVKLVFYRVLYRAGQE